MGKVNGVFLKTLSVPVVPNIEPRVPTHVGRQGQWFKDQQKLIDDAVPEWLHYSLVINARLDGGHTDLQDWKKKEANRLLSLPEFSVLPDGMDLAKARKTIVRKFTNERNRAKDKHLEDSSKRDSALRAAAAAMVDYTAYSKGKSLFRRVKNDLIVERRNEIINEAGGMVKMPVAAAHQKALKELWNEADQEYWESGAIDEVDDVHGRQQDFALHIFNCMYGLSRSGVLGKLELLMLYAFRDRFDKIECGLLETHHASAIPNFSDSAYEFSGVKEAFEGWASNVIPEKVASKEKKEPLHVISRRTDGLPLFPIVHVGAETPDTLRKVLEGYFSYVWEFCRPGEGEIPWDDISARPVDYYDSLQHSFTLSNPAQLSNPEVTAIAEVLSDSEPFRFLPGYLNPLEQTDEAAGTHPLPDPNVAYHGVKHREKNTQAQLNSYFPVSIPITSSPPPSPEVIDVDFEPSNNRSSSPADASPSNPTSNPTTILSSPPEQASPSVDSEGLTSNTFVPTSSHAITSNQAPSIPSQDQNISKINTLSQSTSAHQMSTGHHPSRSSALTGPSRSNTSRLSAPAPPLSTVSCQPPPTSTAPPPSNSTSSKSSALRSSDLSRTASHTALDSPCSNYRTTGRLADTPVTPNSAFIHDDLDISPRSRAPLSPVSPIVEDSESGLHKNNGFISQGQSLNALEHPPSPSQASPLVAPEYDTQTPTESPERSSDLPSPEGSLSQGSALSGEVGTEQVGVGRQSREVRRKSSGRNVGKRTRERCGNGAGNNSHDVGAKPIPPRRAAAARSVPVNAISPQSNQSGNKQIAGSVNRIEGSVTLVDGRKGIVERDKKYEGGWFTSSGKGTQKRVWVDDLDDLILHPSISSGSRKRAKRGS